MSPQSLKTLPVCEKCWLDENTVWEPEGVDDDGSIVSRLSGIAIPESLIPGKVHICCMCADLTIVGLFVEKDPESVPYTGDEIELDDWDD